MSENINLFRHKKIRNLKISFLFEKILKCLKKFWKSEKSWTFRKQIWKSEKISKYVKQISKSKISFSPKSKFQLFCFHFSLRKIWFFTIPRKFYFEHSFMYESHFVILPHSTTPLPQITVIWPPKDRQITLIWP